MSDGSLSVAVGLRRGELVAFVGAGGKTTTAWLLLNELVDAGRRAVFTTSTLVFKPVGAALVLDPEPAAEEIRRAIEKGPRVVVAAGLGERGDVEHAARQVYPAQRVKLAGLAPQTLNRLAEELPGVTWLVEADGAQGRLAKAPAAHEPVIPSRADRVVVLGSLDAVDRPLDADTVHRPEIAARLLSAEIGQLISPMMLAELLRHPAGGRKGVPPGAEVVVVLTEWGEPREAASAAVAEELMRGGHVARVVRADLRAEDPVVASWTDLTTSR